MQLIFVRKTVTILKVYNMTTKEILDLVALRNEIVSKIENFIDESDLSEDEVSDVLAEITEKINELGPA